MSALPTSGRLGREHSFAIGGDRGFHFQLDLTPRFRDLGLHLWLGARGVHMYATPGQVNRRVIFDRIED